MCHSSQMPTFGTVNCQSLFKRPLTTEFLLALFFFFLFGHLTNEKIPANGSQMCVQGLSKAVIFLSCLFLFIQSPSLSSHGVPAFPHYFESQEMLACDVS